MSSSETAFVYHGIIPHPTEPRVLLLPGENGWTLPRGGLHWLPNQQDSRHVIQTIADTLHLDVTVLRCLEYALSACGGRAEAVYALEGHTSLEAPPGGGAWIGRDRLPEVSLARPEHHALISTYLEELVATQLPQLRRPWAIPGWFTTAESWFQEQLLRLELAATGPVEQFRTWARSCILRVPTETGAVFFKAVPPRGAPEPGLLSVLSTRYPQHLPRVLAVDTDRNWMLLGDLGDQTFCGVEEVDRWEEALRLFAQIQIDLSDEIDHLLAMGCPDQRLSTLEAGLGALLADPDAALVGKPGGLTPDEVEAVGALAPRLHDGCARLAAFRVPESLDHADLWAGNIVPGDGGPIFFDWAESSVAHPFFSFLLFMPDATHRLSHVPDARRRLRDAYLEPWTVYEPMERLIDAFELAQPLAALHHALLQHRVVLPNLEPSSRWELEGEIPWDLKFLLRHAEKLQ
jgi:hypothetical protein